VEDLSIFLNSIFSDSEKPEDRTPVKPAAPPAAVPPARKQQPFAPLIVSTKKKPPASLALIVPASPQAARSTAATAVEPTVVEPTVEPAAVATTVEPTAAATAVEPTAEPTAVATAVAEPIATTAVAEQPSTQPSTQPDTPQESAQPDTPQPGAPAKRRKRKRRHTKATTKTLFLVALRDVCIALVLLTILLQFFTPTVVREHSMEDTLKENEILYIAKKAYWFGSPQHGDIVVFRTQLTDEDGAEKSLVKRVIGLPGDRIFISGGIVFRDGVPLDEPYLKSGQTPGDMSEVMVPANSYFVLGDNREVSNDSRNAAVGFIERTQMQGKVLLRIFPLSDFRVF
jgi:signal peptidase I